VEKNEVTLNSGLGVVQGHWKWSRSTDHIRSLYLLVGHCAFYCIIYELFGVE